MWKKRKQLIIATAVIGLMVAAAPALKAVAAGTSSPFGQGNPLDALQGQIDKINIQLQDILNPVQRQIDKINVQLQNLLNPPLPTKLTGDYSALWSIDCVFNPGGFAFPGSPADPKVNWNSANPPYTQHWTLIGTLQFNGGTTALETNNGMSVLSPLPGRSATALNTNGSCNFVGISDVDAGGRFTLSRAACVGTNDPVPMEGRIGNGGKTLLMATITPTVETFLNAGGLQRVCTRSVVATKIN